MENSTMTCLPSSQIAFVEHELIDEHIFLRVSLCISISVTELVTSILSI